MGNFLQIENRSTNSMAQETRTVVVNFRDIEFSITSINQQTKISDLKRKMKNEVVRFIANIDFDDIEDHKLLLWINDEEIKDDNKSIMPLFRGNKLNVTVEEPIAIVLANPNKNTRFGIYVFPSDQMEEVYYKASQLNCTDDIWFNLNHGNEGEDFDIFSKNWTVRHTLKDGEELKVTNQNHRPLNQQINVRWHEKNEEFQINASMYSTISDIKWILRCRLNISMKKQRLIYNGREFDDIDSLSDFDVQPGSTLFLATRT